MLMDFVESRDLRTSAVSPPPFYLTLSYPNRVINRESNQSQTLEEIGINGDCVIWVTFEDDK